MLKKISLLVMLMALLVVPMTTQAKDSMDENIFIPQDRVIEGNYFKAGNSFDLSGTMEKDVYVVGNIITIDGTIKGDFIGAGNTLRINGIVEGSVRFAGSNIIINGEVGENVMVVSNTLIMNNDSKVGWELMAAGSMMELNGDIGGDVKVAGAVVSVDGTIDGNLYTESAQLSMKDEADVTGTLSYLSETDYSLIEGAVIGGEISIVEAKYAQKADFDFGQLKKVLMFVMLMSFLSALLIAILMAGFMPKRLHEVADEINSDFGRHFGLGLLFVIATPIICFLLMLTVIGIPLAVIVLVMYFVILYLAKIFFSLAMMKMILKWFKQKKEWHIMLMMLVGLLIFFIIRMIPIVGWVIGLLASTTAFSALMVMKKKFMVK